MFERFTDRARRVIVVAQDTARGMGHQQIKPEHLLVALTEGEGAAAKAMAESGVDASALRDKVAQRFENKPSATKLDKIPFSPEAKKALEQSLRSALKLGHNYIGTEHLFFGVEREAEKGKEPLDDLLGVSAAEVHERVLRVVAGMRSAAAMRSPALYKAMGAASREAGGAEMTTGHLLAVMTVDTDSQAAKALALLGVSGEAVVDALAQIPLAETSDASRSAQSIAVTVGETTTLINDPDVVAALRQLNPQELRNVIERAIGLSDPDQATG
jgi:ATP-dependent Clp protease ATP-binding subunit ClpA